MGFGKVFAVQDAGGVIARPGANRGRMQRRGRWEHVDRLSQHDRRTQATRQTNDDDQTQEIRDLPLSIAARVKTVRGERGRYYVRLRDTTRRNRLRALVFFGFF